MAHKVGQDDTLYEPDIRSEVSLEEEDDLDVDRTRKSEMVSGPSVASAVDGFCSLPSGASCLEDSRYRCVEDTSSGGTGGEGHKAGGKVWRQGKREAGGSSGEADMVGGSASSFEAQQEALGAGAVMEHADPNLYSSDEWEESDLSDTDDDHSDSSDDDDPKSQVDRLIDQVTLVYLDGENSNLSSESESSDESDFSDSESDITDVSPLISAAASPLGLSPVLPRRALGTSPLALHDNRDLGLGFVNERASEDLGLGFANVRAAEDLSMGHEHPSHPEEHSDMSVLLKAVEELEEEQRRLQGSNYHQIPGPVNGHQDAAVDSHQTGRSPPIAIHPIDASPHHRHLRRAAGHHRRKNMSFTNEEVRRIDRDNQILLEKIMNAHSRSNTRHHHHQPPHHHHQHHHHHHSTNTASTTTNHSQSFAGRAFHRPANSTVNRRREEEKIRRDNMILLRKIQEAKPSRDVAAFRSPRHHHHRASHSLRPTSSLPATPGSCGASARTAPGHVAATAPRKETAL